MSGVQVPSKEATIKQLREFIASLPPPGKHTMLSLSGNVGEAEVSGNEMTVPADSDSTMIEVAPGAVVDVIRMSANIHRASERRDILGLARIALECAEREPDPETLSLGRRAILSVMELMPTAAQMLTFARQFFGL